MPGRAAVSRVARGKVSSKPGADGYGLMVVTVEQDGKEIEAWD